MFVCGTTWLSAWHRGRVHLVLQVFFGKVRAWKCTSGQYLEGVVSMVLGVDVFTQLLRGGVYGLKHLDNAVGSNC